MSIPTDPREDGNGMLPGETWEQMIRRKFPDGTIRGSERLCGKPRRARKPPAPKPFTERTVERIVHDRDIPDEALAFVCRVLLHRPAQRTAVLAATDENTRRQLADYIARNFTADKRGYLTYTRVPRVTTGDEFDEFIPG